MATNKPDEKNNRSSRARMLSLRRVPRGVSFG